MENVFSTLASYAGNWKVIGSRKFNSEELSQIDRAEVMASKNYENSVSVCFFMKNGTRHYIGLGQNSSAQVGDTLDVNNATLLTLERNGETCLKVE
jgi:hypothetical protein